MKDSFLKNIFYSFILLIVVTSCGSQKGNANLYDPAEVNQLSRKLGIEISNQNKEDDKYMPLYAEVSQWVGVPYKYAGMTKKGTDCSGFTYQVYKKVYKINLPRSTSGLAKSNFKKISKSDLRSGDLVLFATSKNKNAISHVGIYLKQGKFIHASTSKGIIVSGLSENYYKGAWRRGVRVL